MITSRLRAPLTWLIVSSALSHPLVASAQTPTVDGLIRRGLDLRRNGRDLEAYDAFESAWALSHSARARAQMGLAAQALGRWAVAERLLREALAAEGDAWVDGHRAVLDRSLAEIDAHLGRLELRCNVEGAVVRVDGTVRGTTPLLGPLRLPAGTVTLQVSAPDHLGVTRQAMVTVGQTTREQIDLVPAPRALAPAPTSSPVVVAMPVLVAPPPPPRVDEPPGSLRRTLAWTTGGVALAGVGLGAAFLALRNAAADEFNARNADTDTANDCARGATSPACVDAESAVSTRGAIATTAFVLGGATAVASAVLFATSPSSAPAHAGLRGCTIANGHGAGALTCEFAF